MKQMVRRLSGGRKSSSPKDREEEPLTQLLSKKTLTREEATRIQRAMTGGAEPPPPAALFFAGSPSPTPPARPSDASEAPSAEHGTVYLLDGEEEVVVLRARDDGSADVRSLDSGLTLAVRLSSLARKQHVVCDGGTSQIDDEESLPPLSERGSVLTADGLDGADGARGEAPPSDDPGCEEAKSEPPDDAVAGGAERAGAADDAALAEAIQRSPDEPARAPPSRLPTFDSGRSFENTESLKVVAPGRRDWVPPPPRRSPADVIADHGIVTGSLFEL